MNNGGLGLLCKLRSEWSTATNDSAFCCSLKSCLDFSKKKKQKRKKVFSNHGFKDVGTHYVKKLFCLPRTRFKIFPLLVKDLQGPDASRTKEFVWSPETHQKCLVTPSDEHDYKENMAQASFQESRMEFSGPYFKKSMSSGPREASRKALGYVLASSIPKLPFCSVVALPHQTPLGVRGFGPIQPSHPCHDTSPGRWGDHFSQFAQERPDFTAESPMSQEPSTPQSQSQENQDSWLL